MAAPEGEKTCKRCRLPKGPGTKILRYKSDNKDLEQLYNARHSVVGSLCQTELPGGLTIERAPEHGPARRIWLKGHVESIDPELLGKLKGTGKWKLCPKGIRFLLEIEDSGTKVLDTVNTMFQSEYFASFSNSFRQDSSESDSE